MALRLALLTELRERAERCLASEHPSPAQARELAAAVLSALAALEAAGDEARQREAPGAALSYRTPAPAPGGAAESAEMAAIAALERALEETRARLAEALAALAAQNRTTPG